MLALRIDLLTGRYVATSYNDRTQPEWPPHPARVFSALVATHHSTPMPDLAERRALEWLARQSPPSLCASESAHRTTVPVFVPVNDVGVVPDFWADMSALRSAEEEVEGLRRRVPATEGRDRKVGERELEKAEKQHARDRARFESGVADALAPEAPTAVPAAAALAMAIAVLPEGRAAGRVGPIATRQPRSFPSVTPLEPVVHLVWGEAEPGPKDRQALNRLARRVTRIGHSSSLVACRLIDDPPAPDWVPSERGDRVFRVTGDGQLQRLEEEFVRHREEQPRTLPSRLQAYSRRAGSAMTPPLSVMGEDWIVFRRVDGPALPTRRAPDLAGVLREALMKFAQEPIREVLSGHKPDGPPTGAPHVAFLALPFVLGGMHADGTLLGAAVVFPRVVSQEDRRHVLRAIGTWEENRGENIENSGLPAVPLLLGGYGKLMLQRVQGAIPLRNLDPAVWCGESRHWSTVTPLALDRNPGDLRARRPEEAAKAVRNAVETIGLACVQIGLPPPSAVGVSPVSAFRGAEASVAYGSFPRKEGRLRRVLVHADLTFERPVSGPVLVGAGRYLGLGLCLPRRGED